ncbi:MAG: FeoC-like transcriptional regulator [Burkholderiales bacterium]|jgi:hypothetical protein|nr:FeoC-like transcriptional regulator [Burkholderiales bacterium]
MILLELRDYLKEKQQASLTDLARHFDMPLSAVQPMLAHWVRKGCVIEQKPIAPIVSVSTCGGGSCGGCGRRCDDTPAIIYRWKSVPTRKH